MVGGLILWEPWPMILDGYSHHQRMNVSLCGVHLNCHFFFKPASQRERAWLVCHVQPICNDNICVSTFTTILLALLAGTILITKTFLLLKQTKDSKKCSIIQIPTGLNGYRRNWTSKDHPIKCCSISYILDLHGSWYLCVAVCDNNFKRKHDLCKAQHLFGNDMK